MNELYESIECQNLPLTFQHAIYITRRLGYRYLWIDSLCIIQDSKRDWEQESAIMGDIYAGGICNISALAGKDSRAGCFITRNPLKYVHCRIGAPKKCVEKEAYSITKGDPLPSGTEGHLSTRGWVVQERTLSPRTLHFSLTGIAWECFSRRVNERTVGLGPGPKNYLTALNLPATTTIDLSNPSRELVAFCESWIHLLTMYTGCCLTMEKDGFPAFNGIISEAQNRTKLTPVAGMWKELLQAELLWFSVNCNYTSSDVEQRRPYRTPSWSWGSVGNAVVNIYSELIGMSPSISLKTTILSVKVSNDSTGQVPGGYVQLKGPVSKYRLNF
jgi:Heterokaryon incompatibility protein (HET)